MPGADPPTGPSVNARLEALIALARTMVDSMDFRLLFDSDRQLLSIGYRVDDSTLDSTCYDLLASEARLASFAAIAKGDLPTPALVPPGAHGDARTQRCGLDLVVRIDVRVLDAQPRDAPTAGEPP